MDHLKSAPMVRGITVGVHSRYMCVYTTYICIYINIVRVGPAVNVSDLAISALKVKDMTYNL